MALLVGSAVAVLSPRIFAEEKVSAVRTITPQQLQGILASSDVPLINVHVPYEGEIPGTDAFIPFDKVAAHLAELPADKAAPIVLYCKSGRMSEIAGHELQHLGYTNVSHLAGGFLAWANAGYDLVRR